MRKLLFVALLFQGAHLSANADNVFKEIKDLMDNFNKRFKVVEEYMNTFPAFDTAAINQDDKEKVPAKKDVEILSEKDFIVIKLNLGDLDSTKINIDVDGDSLNGSVPISDGEATFYVQNGRIFGLSFKREAKQKKLADEDKNNTYVACTVSASTKVESLPDQVCDLENMVANYNNDGVLELKLPRIPQKKGTKINVISNS